MIKSSIKVVLSTAMMYMLLSFNAFAISLDYGQLVNVWEAPDNTAMSVKTHLADTSWALTDGQKLTELARNSDTIYTDGLFNLPLAPTFFGYNTGKSTDGLWAYLGGAKVDFLAVATTTHFALYSYNSPEWIGLWTTDAISDFVNKTGQGMAHITAYSVSAVPLPAAAPLFVSAIALFGFINHRRKARKS